MDLRRTGKRHLAPGRRGRRSAAFRVRGELAASGAQAGSSEDTPSWETHGFYFSFKEQKSGGRRDLRLQNLKAVTSVTS